MRIVIISILKIRFNSYLKYNPYGHVRSGL